MRRRYVELMTQFGLPVGANAVSPPTTDARPLREQNEPVKVY